MCVTQEFEQYPGVNLPITKLSLYVLDMPSTKSPPQWVDPVFSALRGTLVFEIGEKVKLYYKAFKPNSKNQKLRTVATYNKHVYLDIMNYLTDND